MVRNSNGAPGREGVKEEESLMRKASGLGLGVVVVLAVMVSLGVGYTQVTANGVTIVATLPDVEAGLGDVVEMPVTLSDVGDSEIISAQMDITYDPGVVDVAVEGAVSLGTIVPEGWEIWYNLVYGDGGAVLQIAMAGASPLIGSGTLVVIDFQCMEYHEEGGFYVEEGGFYTPVAFESMTLNEGEPSVETQHGSITVY